MIIKRKKIIYYLAALSALIFFIFLSPLKTAVNFALNPVLVATNQFPGKVKNFFIFFTERQTLSERNKELDELLRNYLVDQVEFQKLKTENEELKKILDYQKGNKNQNKGVLAAVIGRDTGGDPDVFLVDRGAADGVKNYSAVTRQDQLVAQVIKIDNEICFARSIFSEQSKISAKILSSKNKVDGEVVGERGLALRMKLIPPESELKENDLVVTAGLEDNIPAGIVIGRVQKVEKPLNTFFQEAVILPLSSFDQIYFVSLVSN